MKDDYMKRKMPQGKKKTLYKLRWICSLVRNILKVAKWALVTLNFLDGLLRYPLQNERALAITVENMSKGFHHIILPETLSSMPHCYQFTKNEHVPRMVESANSRGHLPMSRRCKRNMDTLPYAADQRTVQTISFQRRVYTQTNGP